MILDMILVKHLQFLFNYNANHLSLYIILNTIKIFEYFSVLYSNFEYQKIV